jgi:hypothetical protein
MGPIQQTPIPTSGELLNVLCTALVVLGALAPPRLFSFLFAGDLHLFYQSIAYTLIVVAASCIDVVLGFILAAALLAVCIRQKRSQVSNI